MAQNNIVPNKLIVVGGSSGSLEVLLDILPVLPADYPFPLLIVMHRNNSGDSLLCDLLARKSKIPVKEVEEKDPVLRGHIYLVPGDYHVLIEPDRSFSLDYSEKVNFSRPSIDVTFFSAAEVYRDELTGILLSGANDDGARGLREIKIRGGTTLVQDPEEASVDMMPREAIRRSKIDLVLKAGSIGDYLISLANQLR